MKLHKYLVKIKFFVTTLILQLVIAFRELSWIGFAPETPECLM